MSKIIEKVLMNFHKLQLKRTIEMIPESTVFYSLNICIPGVLSFLFFPLFKNPQLRISTFIDFRERGREREKEREERKTQM